MVEERLRKEEILFKKGGQNTYEVPFIREFYQKHFLLMSKVGLGAEEDNIYFCHCESLNLHSLIAF